MRSADIILSYPWWVFVLSILLAGGLSYLLYTRNYFDAEDSKPLRISLAVLRTIFMSLLIFLILGPLLKSNKQELEKANFVLAFDRSASMTSDKDSAELSNFFRQVRQEATNALGDQADIHTLHFGDNVTEAKDQGFQSKATNISKLLQVVDDQYENRNLGGVILITDGIYNQGPNPEYQKRRSRAPIYSIGLGDTNTKRDLILQEVRHNDIAFLGNEFPLELSIKGQKLQSGKSILTISSANKTLFEEELSLSSGTFSLSKNLFLKAEKVGIQDIRISLSAVPGEVSTVNNTKRIFVEVLDARNKVLIHAFSPHPDVSALKQSIESNKNYEVAVNYSFQETEPELKDVDLLILHRLPQYDQPITQLLEAASKKRIPTLFIVDETVYSQALSRFAPEFGFQARRGEINESLPSWNTDFSLFELSQESLDILKAMPPLKSPYARYSPFPKNRVLSHQQIGAIKTDQPMIAFSQNAERKSGIIYGTGFWRWRIYEYEKTEAHAATNELINRSIQFLSAQENKTPFRVRPVARSFYENETVRLEAQLYNDAFQLIVEPDVQLVIKDEEGKEFKYTMGRSFKQYSLDAGYLKPGMYTYEATCSYNGEVRNQRGSFLVKPLQLEDLNTTARHDLLKRLSEKSGGSFATQEELSQLFKTIQTNGKFKTVSYYRSSFLDFIELQWFFWVLLAFISSEWIIRKLKGAY